MVDFEKANQPTTAYLSLHVEGDAKEKWAIEAHFQGVVPVLGVQHGLWRDTITGRVSERAGTQSASPAQPGVFVWNSRFCFCPTQALLSKADTRPTLQLLRYNPHTFLCLLFYPGAVVVAVLMPGCTTASLFAPRCRQDESRPGWQCCSNARPQLVAEGILPSIEGSDVSLNFVLIKIILKNIFSVCVCFTQDKKRLYVSAFVMLHYSTAALHFLERKAESSDWNKYLKWPSQANDNSVSNHG